MHRLAAILALAALLPSTALAAGSSQSWAKREIKQVTRQGIFAGTPATFRGSDALTRGSLEHVVAKLTGAPEQQVADGSAPVSIEDLDRSLVQALGLRDSAYRFYLAARRAQITPPPASAARSSPACSACVSTIRRVRTTSSSRRN